MTDNIATRWLTLSQAATFFSPDMPPSIGLKRLLQDIDIGILPLYVQLQSQEIIIADPAPDVDPEFYTTSEILQVHLTDDPRCDSLHAWLRSGAKGQPQPSGNLIVPQVIFNKKVFDLVYYDSRYDDIEMDLPTIKPADLVMIESTLKHSQTKDFVTEKTGLINSITTETYVRPKPDDENLLNAEEVLTMLGIGRSTWYDGISEGIFPKPIKFKKSARWEKSDIRKLIEERKPGGRTRRPT